MWKKNTVFLRAQREIPTGQDGAIPLPLSQSIITQDSVHITRYGRIGFLSLYINMFRDIDKLSKNTRTRTLQLYRKRLLKLYATFIKPHSI